MTAERTEAYPEEPSSPNDALPPEAVEVDWPEPDEYAGDGLDEDTGPADSVSGMDKRRLEKARDCLIDAEDELLYVAKRDPSLAPVIDRVVDALMDVSKRAEGMRP